MTKCGRLLPSSEISMIFGSEADLAKMPSVGVNRLVSVVFSVSASYATAELDEVQQLRNQER